MIAESLVIGLLILTACVPRTGAGLQTYREPEMPACWVENAKEIRNECISPSERWDLANKILELRFYYRELNGAAEITR